MAWNNIHIFEKKEIRHCEEQVLKFNRSACTLESGTGYLEDYADGLFGWIILGASVTTYPIRKCVVDHELGPMICRQIYVARILSVDALKGFVIRNQQEWIWKNIEEGTNKTHWNNLLKHNILVRALKDLFPSLANLEPSIKLNTPTVVGTKYLPSW